MASMLCHRHIASYFRHVLDTEISVRLKVKILDGAVLC